MNDIKILKASGGTGQGRSKGGRKAHARMKSAAESSLRSYDILATGSSSATAPNVDSGVENAQIQEPSFSEFAPNTTADNIIY